MKKKLIIMGGGVSGTTAGVLGLLSGYDVEIYEKNAKLGGNCGAYYKNGYLIDHCIHWLIGSNINTLESKGWKDIGAFNEDTKIIGLPHLLCFYEEGKFVTLSKDYKASHKQWLELYPEDKEAIDEFFDFVSKAADITTQLTGETAEETKRIRKRFFKHNAKYIPTLLKTSIILRRDYAKKFKSPVLRKLIENAQNGYASLFSFLYEYLEFIHDNANIPSGGTLKFITNIQNHFVKLGGKVFVNSPVKNVSINKKHIEYIELENGNKVTGDAYICGMSPYYFHEKITSNKYLDRYFKKVMKKEKTSRIPTAFMASLSIPYNLVKIETPSLIHCDNVRVGVSIQDCLNLRVYDYDDIYIKDGRVVMNILVDQTKDDFLFWESLNKEDYLKEKERIIKEMIESIEKVFPILKGKIEYIDSFTPVTLNKYTNSPFGGYMVVPLTKDNKMFLHSPKCKTIKNLYYATQWISSPGGLPMARNDGQWCINQINKDFKKKASN